MTSTTVVQTGPVPRRTSELRFDYEGKHGPHSLAKVFMDGGSLCCEHCGACVVDHRVVGMDHGYDVSWLRWTMKVDVRFAFGDGVLEEANTATLEFVDEALPG